MKNMLNDLRNLTGLAAVLVVVVLLVVAPAYGVTAYECAAYERATGRPTKMAGLSCFVHDGRWYAWAEYKNRFAPKGH